MRKLYRFLSLFFFFFYNAPAQNPVFQWAHGFGSASADEGRSVAVDLAGNVYMTGYFGDTVNFDPTIGTPNLISAGSSDIFLAKYNSWGIYQWAFRIGGTLADNGWGVTTDDSGNIIVTGDFKGTTIDFDPGPGVANLSSSGFNDIFIAKYNASGVYQWAFSIGGTGEDVSYEIATDLSNNIIITGGFEGSNVDFDPGISVASLSASAGKDIFVAKYNSSGSYQWAFKIGGTGYDEGWEVVTDASENVLVTGDFGGSNVDFDPGAGTANLSASSSDIFVAKYDSSGNYQWAFKIGSGGYDGGWGIAVDHSKNVLITGSFAASNIDFDPGVGTSNLSSAGGDDVFVAKYDSTGVYQWAFNIGGVSNDLCDGIVTDNDNNVIITGIFSGNNIDFNPDTGINNLNSGTIGSNDIFVAKYSAAGFYLWAFNIGSATAESSYGYGITSDGLGDIFVTGNISGNDLDFDADTGVTNINSHGSIDIFIAKYASCNLPPLPLNTTPTINLTVCVGNSTILSASGTTLLNWYTDSMGGTFLGSGNTFVTPPVFINTTFYVQDSSCVPGKRTPITVAVNPNTTPINTTINQTGNTLTAQATGVLYQWIDCNNGNMEIPGATNQSFNTDVSGSFAVVITLGGCSDTSSCFTTIGIETIENDNWSIFPNPAQGIVNIATTGLFENIPVVIYDLKGTMIYHGLLNGKTVSINLSGFENGVYSVVVGEEGMQWRQKMVVIK